MFNPLSYFMPSYRGSCDNYLCTVLNSATKILNSNKTDRAVKDLSEALLKNTEMLSTELAKLMESSISVIAPAIRKIGIRYYLLEIFPIFLTSSILTIASNFAIQYIYQVSVHGIGRPKLAIEQHITSRVSFITKPFENLTKKITGIFLKVKDKPSPIFKKSISRRITDITNDMKNIRKNNGNFQNVLLYGPPGTGKTMISRAITEVSGMNYIRMSGGDLPQYIKRGEHVTEFNKLMNSVERSSQPTVIFIDEADSLCRKREDLDQKMLELQNAFLNRTGTQSKKLMLILATNRKDNLDDAVLSRMDYKIKIDGPGFTERTKIIRMYAEEFFSETDVEKFFNPIRCKAMALKTSSFTGRSLYKLINTVNNRKLATKDNKLSFSTISSVLSEFISQERGLQKHSIITKIYLVVKDIFASFVILLAQPYFIIKGY